MWDGMALGVGTRGSIFIKLIKRNNFVLSFRNAGAVKGADTGAKFSSSPPPARAPCISRCCKSKRYKILLQSFCRVKVK